MPVLSARTAVRMTIVIFRIRLFVCPILLPFIIVRFVGVGPVPGLSFALPTPFTSLPELSPVFSIRAGSEFGPEWGQVVRLAACFYQPLLIVGHIQTILVLHLIGPRGLMHMWTIVPPGVRRPCLVTEIPLRTNGNQGRQRRVMGLV